jgi:hypothetical protein
MNKWSRRSWIWFAGVATVLLTVWTMMQNEDEAAVNKPERKSVRRAEQGQPIEDAGVKNKTESVDNLRLDLLVRESTAVEKANPFATPPVPKPAPKKIVPPPPPEPPPPPPPPPTAPPLPFNYLGSYEDGNKKIIMLVRDNKIFNAVEGVNLDSIYRVEKIYEHRIEVIYLPLGISQSIDIVGNVNSSKK